MIESLNKMVVCQECASEADISYEDVYGHQYEIRFCPFCGQPDVITEDIEVDEEF